jgi:hypothetical protein
MRFATQVDELFGTGTGEHNNGTLGGMPVQIFFLNKIRQRGMGHRTVSETVQFMSNNL